LGVISISSSASQYEIVSSKVILFAGATKFLSSFPAARKLLKVEKGSQRRRGKREVSISNSRQSLGLANVDVQLVSLRRLSDDETDVDY